MEDRVSKALRRYNYLYSETGAIYHRMYTKLGMSDSAISILYVLLERGGHCMLQDICHDTGLSKQTINSAIRKLEAQGVLYLELVGAKNKTVQLTQVGQALAENTAGRVIQAENEIFASWPQQDVEKYLELTEAYMLALKQKLNEI